MELLLLLISYIAVGTVAYFIGGDRMKKNIEKQLLDVLDKHSKSQGSK